MDFMAIFDSVFHIVGPTLGSVVLAAVGFVLTKKLHLQVSSHQMQIVGDLVQKGIAFAEEWAHQKATEAPPTPEAKLAQATAFVKNHMAVNKVKVKLTEPQINDLIHSTLGALRK